MGSFSDASTVRRGVGNSDGLALEATVRRGGKELASSAATRSASRVSVSPKENNS